MTTCYWKPVRAACLLAFIAAGALCFPALAAGEEKTLKNQLEEFTADLGIPATPAAVLVGLSGESVLMPKNRREFEAGVSTLFDGTSRPTGAIEFAPYYIFKGGKLSYPAYRSRFSLRALTKTTLGLASGARKVDDKEISATGYSLSTVFYDLSDPIYSLGLANCINRMQAGVVERANAQRAAKGEPLPEEDSTIVVGEEELVDEQALTDYKACVGKNLSTAGLWNRSKLAAGVVGGRGREKDGDKRDVLFGKSVWLSGQYGFEGWNVLRRTVGSAEYYDCDTFTVQGTSATCSKEHDASRWERSSMLTVHARYTRDYSDLDLAQTGELRRLSSRLFGARFTYGSDKRNFFIEASQARVKGDAVKKRIDQQAFGASFRVSENLWVNAVSARRKNFLNDKLDSVMEVNLQFGAASEPLVRPIK